MFRRGLVRAAKIAAGAGGVVVGTTCLTSAIFASGADHVHHAHHPWNFTGYTESYDHASIRRGHMVYQQICSSCHSMDFMCYRHLIGVAYSEAEIKAMAKEIDVEDGPNGEGEMFLRPGKPTDHFPNPYPNEEAARATNGGALPPDLSLITKARHGGADYVFSLITGYTEPPEGHPPLREGLYYNPYFPGGAIGMPPQLMDGAVEFPDGAPPIISQYAKDVSTFLSWAAEPEMEERKLLGIKVALAFGAAAIGAGYYKRFKWYPFKTRTMYYR